MFLRGPATRDCAVSFVMRRIAPYTRFSPVGKSTSSASGLPGEFHRPAAILTQLGQEMGTGGDMPGQAAEMANMDFAGIGSAGPVAYAGDGAPVHVAFGPRFPVVPVFFRVVGTFLILVAAAMWVLPGSTTDADLVLMKLGASLFFLFCGVAVVMVHHSDNVPEACFDPIRREFRVLVKTAAGQPRVVLRRGYDTIGRAHFQNNRVELYDFDGRLLLGLRVTDPARHAALERQLRQLVNICS